MHTKKLAIFDVDNTLVNGFTEKLLISYLYRLGKIKKSILLEVFLWFLKYELGIEKDVINIRKKVFRMFKGWKVKEAGFIFSNCFSQIIRPRIFIEAIDIIKKHSLSGFEVILISASLEPLIEELKRFLNLRFAISTRLEIKDGKYTGETIGHVMYGINKCRAIQEFARKEGFALQDSYVYADHISDLSLLELATNPVVVNPKRMLRKTAKLRNWPILKFKKIVGT